MKKKKPRLPCINCITLAVCLEKSSLALVPKCKRVAKYLQEHKVTELPLILVLKNGKPKFVEGFTWMRQYQQLKIT